MVALSLIALVAFALGFLLGERRGVTQANAILDHNNRTLLEAIGSSSPPPGEGEGDEQRPTLH